MIHTIRIENFKCLRDIEVDLGPFNVLIGSNDSGKSSFLQAIEQLRGLILGSSFSDSMIWNRDRNLKSRITVTTDSHVLPFELPLVGAKIDSFVQSHGILAQSLAASETYRLDPRSLRQPAQASNVARLNSDGSNLASVLHAMLIGADRQAFFEIEKRFHEEVPTLKEVSTPITEHGSYRIDFKLNLDVRPAATIPADQASDGAMLLLAFLVLVHGDAPDILLIEEPENGLHPSRLKMIIAILRKIADGEIGDKPRQVIVTTHSPLLLNFVKAEEVRIFRRDEKGATQVTAMNSIPNIDRLQKEFAPGELWYLFGEEELVTGHAT